LLLKVEREKVIAEMLQYSKRRFKRFDEVIIQLSNGEDLERFFTTDRRMWKINECFNATSKKDEVTARVLLKEVFIYLDQCSLLTSDETFIHGVYNAFQFRGNWVNDIFGWKPASKKAALQFKELAHYLFCWYDVPEFLYKSFYETNLLFVKWFIHLGTGGRVIEMEGIPIPFTKKMGHYFTQAPSKMAVTEALRWAQVKGMKGDEKLAERIAYSWIGTKPFEDEAFWESFLHLMLLGGMFNYNKLTELIDYVRVTRRENPEYDLKGRTLQSVIRQSDKWHGQYVNVKGNWFWQSCGIEGFKMNRKTEIIKLEELTEAKKLVEEGWAMKHCVASYTQYCAEGRSAIFSLRKYADGLLKEILATIEVNIFLKKIVQAKARMNKPISEEAKKYVESWAAKNALALSPYL
jgi:hypothetical protein